MSENSLSDLSELLPSSILAEGANPGSDLFKQGGGTAALNAERIKKQPGKTLFRINLSPEIRDGLIKDYEDRKRRLLGSLARVQKEIDNPE